MDEQVVVVEFFDQVPDRFEIEVCLRGREGGGRGRWREGERGGGERKMSCGGQNVESEEPIVVIDGGKERWRGRFEWVLGTALLFEKPEGECVRRCKRE